MRWIALALVCALGCSGAEPSVAATDAGGTDTTRDDAGDDDAVDPVFDVGADVSETAAPDTASDEGVDSAPPADTAPPPDTCVPESKAALCSSPSPGLVACGSPYDGCGGRVACDPCGPGRMCVAHASAPSGGGVCGCTGFPYYSPCTTKSGATGHSFNCAPSAAPVDSDCKSIPASTGADPSWVGWCCAP